MRPNTKSSKIIELLDMGIWSVSEIAIIADCLPEYVRVVKQRRGHLSAADKKYKALPGAAEHERQRMRVYRDRKRREAAHA